MTIFTNSFHNTSINIREDVPGTGQDEQFVEIFCRANDERKPGKYTRRLKRIRKNLCGMADCCCGTVR